MRKKTTYHLLQEEKNRRVETEKSLSLRLRQQEVIAYLGEYAIRTRDLDSLFSEATRLVAETLEMDFCNVLELLPDGNELLLRAGVGWRAGLVGKATVGAGLDSQAGYTLISAEPVIVHDLRSEERFSGPALLVEHAVVSGMSVVIPGREKPWGVLGAHTTRLRDFKPHDTRFMVGVASTLGSAIERLRIEEELRRSRDEQQIILNGVTEGITVQDRSGKLIYANPGAAKIIGYDSVEELLAAPIEQVLQKFQLLDEQGNPFPGEQIPGRLVLLGAPQASARIRFKITETGVENWSIVDSTAVRNAEGQVVQAVNIFRDITDIILAEQSQKFLAEAGGLLASSLDYEATLNNIANLAVTRLADWCVVHLVSENQQVQQLAVAHKDPSKVEIAREYQRRYPPDKQSGVYRVLRTGELEFYPQLSEELLDATARDEEQRRMMRVLGLKSVIIAPLVARGRVLGAITLIWAESGRRYTQVEVNLVEELARRAAIAIDNARLYKEAQTLNAELEQRVAKRTQELEMSYNRLLREIDERKKAEGALLKSETLLNSLFESAPDAIILVDKSGKVVRVNQQAEAIFGFSREELLGRSIDSLLPEQLRGSHHKHRDDFFKQMTTRTMGAGLELSAVRKDGTSFPVDIMLSPVITEEGELVISAVRDMTEQKRLQTELSETHRRLFESIEAERLSLSQELHDGPIQDLYGVALYLETLSDDIQNPQSLEELTASKETVQAVVRTLRGICGELRPPALDHFGLEKAIRSHLMRVQEVHPEIQIEMHLMNDRRLLSDRARLALFRVYQNSISNTLRHAGATHIRVDLSIERQQLVLRVADNGRGFEVPRRSVELVRAGHFGLVGMTERVEAVGGRLSVQSAVGQGTAIEVVIPVEAPSQPQFSPSPAAG